MTESGDSTLLEPERAQASGSVVERLEALNRALEVERARLAAVFRQAPSFLAVLRGPDHVFEHANDAYLALAGHSADEILGRPLVEAIPEVRGQGFVELLDRVLATGEPFVGREVPAMVLRASGALEQAFVDFVYQPLVEADGTRSGVVVHGSVVTDHVRARREVERLFAESEAARAALADANALLQEQQVELELSNQQLQDNAVELEVQAEELQASAESLARANTELEEQERQLRMLVDAIPTLAWTALADGFIDWYNARWYEYTGATPAAMEGWGWQSVHDPVVLPQVLEQWTASIATGRPFEMTFPLRGADGSYRQFLTRVVPLADADGRIARWFGTNTDVTPERAARVAAEEANQSKTDFLTTMSHELRTPLNAIAGYAELLDLGIHGPISEPQREAIGRIQRSQRHLLGLINDVLNYARLEAGRVEYAAADVPVRQAIGDVEPLVALQFRAKQIRLDLEECPEDLVARADREKLQQILVNVLSNAVKFTPPGGAVTVRCRRAGDAVAIAVEDTGIGIAADRLEHVFAPFVQIDRRLNSPHQGTGLGLAISRDLARGMGGDLTAESRPGMGSTFTLTLPAAAA
jgi:PAS domain S-box-containing protein